MEQLKYLFLCLGPFHWALGLPRCQYDNHYIRALTWKLMVRNLTCSLQWQMLRRYKVKAEYPELAQVKVLHWLQNNETSDAISYITTFENESEAKSELCQLCDVWLQ